MATVQQVFDQAMGLMDELSAAGESRTADTKEYEYRTPGLVNLLTAELRLRLGLTEGWLPVADMEDEIPTADLSFALGVMGYGLAANLLTDENPTAASFFQQRYEELLERWLRSRPAQPEAIETLYGLNEHGQFGRW